MENWKWPRSHSTSISQTSSLGKGWKIKRETGFNWLNSAKVEDTGRKRDKLMVHTTTIFYYIVLPDSVASDISQFFLYTHTYQIGRDQIQLKLFFV